MSKTVQVKLLNDGGYGMSNDVVFPVEVEAREINLTDITRIDGYSVSYKELNRVGFNNDEFNDDDGFFFYLSEAEEINQKTP